MGMWRGIRLISLIPLDWKYVHRMGNILSVPIVCVLRQKVHPQTAR